MSAGDKKLDRNELKDGLRDYGVTLSDRELDVVLSAFDRNKDGKIDFDEFLRGIRVRRQRLPCFRLEFPFLDPVVLCFIRVT